MVAAGLAEDDVAVWTARPEDIGVAEAAGLRVALLDDAERVRADRYLRAEDRHLFVVAHALLRLALSRHGGLAPDAWRFTTGEHGRPALVPEDGTPRVGFSLAHTPGLVACAVSDEIDCGIDVEGFGRVSDPRGLAKRYFSARENADLDLVPDREIDERFVRLWTLKEAYVKARGLGLSLPLDSFHFAVEHGVIRAGFDAPASDREDAWQFEQHRVESTHGMALAVRRRGDGLARRVLLRDGSALLREQAAPPAAASGGSRSTTC